MSNAFITYGFQVFAVVLMALITWGPTLLSFRRRRRGGEAVPLRQLTLALLIELGAMVGLAAAVEALGLLNPGGYLLASALIIGAAGGQIFSRMGVKQTR